MKNGRLRPRGREICVGVRDSGDGWLEIGTGIGMAKSDRAWGDCWGKYK